MTDDPYVPNADFLRVRREAIAHCIVIEVTDPQAARGIALRLFGEHNPIPRATVAAMFGEEAAQAWDDVKTAIATLKEKLK